jgi:hypothetical protein
VIAGENPVFAVNSGARKAPNFRVKWWRPAVAAALSLAFLAGFYSGRGSTPGQVASIPECTRAQTADFELLRKAVSESCALMPRQVAWTALRDGQLQLGTLPLAGENPSEIWLLSFYWQAEGGARKQLCQIALLGTDEARLEWRQDGQWELKARVVADGAGRRLLTTLAFTPEDQTRKISLAAGSALAECQAINIAAANLGARTFTLSAVAQRMDIAIPACGWKTRL